MGALHDGHRSLIKLAKTLAMWLVSIFVNPLQFGPGEDYARYPRPLEDDLRVCEADGVDIVFVPSVSDLYPPAAGQPGRRHPGIGARGTLPARPLQRSAHRRPEAVQHHPAAGRHLGEKDAQQLACIQRMVTDLNIAIEVVGAPIVREPDGLALSSRNIFLTASERRRAAFPPHWRRPQPKLGPSARAAAYEVLDRAEAEPSLIWTTRPSSIRPRSLRSR